jgi:NADP-dependent 3-hydroxy acid dehydrogenase YdfG
MKILITGATSGFGKAMAEKFAAKGHNLIITGRRADRLNAFADEIKNQITHGKAGMPPFESMLTVQEIDALTAYCMKLSGR